MKKDLKVIIGIALVGVLMFLIGAYLYNKSAALDRAAQDTARSEGPLAERLVRSDSPSLGPAAARVTLVEFLDPECESCRAIHHIVKRLLEEYSGRVHYVIRYMPFHANSLYAASALEAAGRQGKYWEALDTLFEHQPEWGSHHNPQPQRIPEYLRALGLDMKRFEADIQDPAFKAKVQRDRNDGFALGVRATPTFFVNGREVQELGYVPLKSALEEAFSR